METYTEELITIEELCEIMSIGKNTAYRLLQNKEIKAFRIGRIWKISKAAVINYIRKESGLA